MSRPAEPFLIPTDPEKLIAWAERKRELAYRTPEFQSKENLAFFLGKQWGVWNKDARRFDSPAQHKGDANAPVRITANKISGLGERAIARLLKSSPIPECRPVTDTDSDVDSAKVGTRTLDHELDRLKYEQKLLELYFWVMPIGWSFFHVRWDADAGPEAGIDEETGESIPQGEVCLEEVPAFELVLDPNARRFRDAAWCIRTVAMTREAAFEQYGKTPETGESSSSMSEEWRFQDPGFTDENGRGTGSTKGQDGFISVHQLWLKPSKSNPAGLVVTWSGQTILEDAMPFPYEHGRLPFVPYNLLPALGGGAAGRTWITDLVGLQKDYNDARSREAAIRRVLTPKVLAARGQIDQSRLTSRVEVVDYNPTGPEPKWWMPDGRWLTQYEQAMNRADSEMGERAGQGEASQGNAASSAPAAAIMALQEADETKLAVSAKELAASTADLGWQLLMLVRQFWTEERIVRTWSRDGDLEVAHFTGSDLGQELDVHVSSESALPRSKSARVQMAIDLYSQGILGTGPAANKSFVRMLDLPGTDFLLETLNKDSKQAEREHSKLLQGQPVDAAMWHNHAAHIEAHDDFRKSEEYEQLDPQTRAWFDGHVTAHYGMVLGQMSQPTPIGTPQDPGATEAAAAAQNPSGENGEYTNPQTGLPQDPLSVAAGLAPSALQGSSAQAAQGVVGGTGNPGPVPGQSTDSTAYRTGN